MIDFDRLNDDEVLRIYLKNIDRLKRGDDWLCNNKELEGTKKYKNAIGEFYNLMESLKVQTGELIKRGINYESFLR